MCTEQPLNTFVIRFWHRSAEDGPGWVGQIRHVQSEEYSVFIDFAAMQDFIQVFGVELARADLLIQLETILGEMDKVRMLAAGMNFKQFEDRLKTDRRYADVNLRELWRVVKHDIPDLRHRLEQILKEYNFQKGMS